MQLSALGEFGFIDRLACGVRMAPGVRLGIGDDCAVTDAPATGSTLTTTDLLVEGVHFDLRYTDPASLGYKSLAVNLSDIAAMGGIPRHVLLGLAVPAATPVEFLDAFVAAFLDLANQHHVVLIGGDTCASRSGLLVSVTAIGEQEPARILTRGGARPGDLVVVSGTIGDSAMGLQLLQAGNSGSADDDSRHCIERHLRPTPRLALGQLLANRGLARAMIDVSDGLQADLGHILHASSVGASLDLARIPLSPSFRKLAGTIGDSFWELAIAGGEDYELLFTVPADREADLQSLQTESGIPLTVIGTITAEPGLQLRAPDGTSQQPGRGGYNHFA